ncbi:hypothetical protein XENTR_v10022516 [Xenopus tropicalis]|nr:hypothetical protein XENTR_v10022516 [Xenopus tropicalis]
MPKEFRNLDFLHFVSEINPIYIYIYINFSLTHRKTNHTPLLRTAKVYLDVAQCDIAFFGYISALAPSPFFLFQYHPSCLLTALID